MSRIGNFFAFFRCHARSAGVMAVGVALCLLGQVGIILGLGALGALFVQKVFLEKHNEDEDQGNYLGQGGR